MKPVTQTLFGAGERAPDGGWVTLPGNCMQASVASLLELELDEVPHFLTLGNNWVEDQALLRWWLWGRGLDALCLSTNQVGFVYTDQGLPHAISPTTYYLVEGDGPRGHRHMCVGRAGEVAWDPHPDRTGLLTQDYIHLLVKI